MRLPRSEGFCAIRKKYWHLRRYLGTFTNLRTTTFSFVMFVRLSVRLSLCTEQFGSHWTNIYEIRYLSIIRKSVNNVQFSLKSHRLTGTLHEDQYRFMIYVAHFFLEWEKFQTKVAEKIKTPILCWITFSRNCIMHEKRWNNIVEPDRPQMTIRHIRFACWIPKATNTHSECVIILAFPLLQWLPESASTYTYSFCLILNWLCLFLTVDQLFISK